MDTNRRKFFSKLLYFLLSIAFGFGLKNVFQLNIKSPKDTISKVRLYPIDGIEHNPNRHKPRFKMISINISKLKREGKIPQHYTIDDLIKNIALKDKVLNDELSKF